MVTTVLLLVILIGALLGMHLHHDNELKKLRSDLEALDERVITANKRQRKGK